MALDDFKLGVDVDVRAFAKAFFLDAVQKLRRRGVQAGPAGFGGLDPELPVLSVGHGLVESADLVPEFAPEDRGYGRWADGQQVAQVEIEVVEDLVHASELQGQGGDPAGFGIGVEEPDRLFQVCGGQHVVGVEDADIFTG